MKGNMSPNCIEEGLALCGICGFTEASGSAADYATLKAMCDVMAHRGPDGEGFYVADIYAVANGATYRAPFLVPNAAYGGLE